MRARHYSIYRFFGRYSSAFGIDILPYQLALGLSLRWLEGGPHLRVYLGPFKLRASLWRTWHQGPDAIGSGLDADSVPAQEEREPRMKHCRRLIIAVVCLTLTVVGLVAAYLWMHRQPSWDVASFVDQWGLPPSVARQIDPKRGRYQTVKAGSPAYCYPPREREGRVFPQVVTAIVYDLQQNQVVSCLPTAVGPQ